jgi:hypothetical protein
MRRLAVTLFALAAFFAAAATSHATLVMTGDSTTVRGEIGLTVYASANLKNIEAGELVDGAFLPLTTFDLLSAGNQPPFGELVVGTNPAVAPWRCDRRTREFLAVGKDAKGKVLEQATFTVRTPSCENRLRVDIPTRIRPGKTATIIIRDSFRQGDMLIRLCRRPPGAKSVCRVLEMPAGVPAISFAFPVPKPGRWRVALGADVQRIARVISVGVEPRPQDLDMLPGVVTTGDSMMQSLDSVLSDRLAGRAELISDVFIGSGITKPQIVDWSRLPRKQVDRDHPKAVIVFLGANEYSPLTALDGTVIQCCSKPWIDEYARRAREIMQTYVQDGKGAVVWLNNPIPGDDRRTASINAVNAALEIAKRGIDRARVLDMAEVFTPGGVYREDMPWKGATVRVRQDDKIHLTIPGARIASTFVLRELTALGVI